MNTTLIYRYGTLDPTEHTELYSEDGLGHYMHTFSATLDAIRPQNFPPRCGSLYASPTKEACLGWKRDLEKYTQKNLDYLYKLEVSDELLVFDAQIYDDWIQGTRTDANAYWDSATPLWQYHENRENLTPQEREKLDFWHEILISPTDIISATIIPLH